MTQIVAQLAWTESQTYQAPLAIYIADLSVDATWQYNLDGFFQQGRIRPFFCSVDNLANQQQVKITFGLLVFTVNQFSRQTFPVPDNASYCVVSAVGAANLPINIVFSLNDISKGDTTNLFAVQNATGKQGSLEIIRTVGNGATTPVASDLGGVILFLNTAASACNLPDASLTGFGSGWNTNIWNDGGSTDNVTITPPGVTTIDGLANLVIPPGDNIRVIAGPDFNWHTERISLPLPPAGSTGFGLVSQGAWPIRPKWAALGFTPKVQAKGASYVMVAADIGTLLGFTGAGPWTLTLMDNATAGNGAAVFVANQSTSVLAVVRAGADVIISKRTNLTTLNLGAGDKGFLIADGAGNWFWYGTRSFDSGQQTITSGGALTLAHGLGVQPDPVDIWLHNVTAEGGYTAGQEVPTNPAQSNATPNVEGVGYIVDATNIKVRFGTATNIFAIPNATTGAPFNVSNANWKAIWRATVLN